ncbi:MAG: hypothetical protein NVSMB9_34330 [Isosphaeraceae bacterium]
MTPDDFTRVVESLGALSAEQVVQLRRALDCKLAPAGSTVEPDPIPGSMRDAEERDEVVDGAMEKRPAEGRKPIWERILERTARIPDEAWDKLPTDLAEQHDHYLYGTPKRPTR